ncbi:hypothetical protein MQE36_12415 [Zhouia spongiae]|uniref:O-antigen ligase domain-containing protein n=1 Tax=Zhouia spongiae TaxID=2202721 RepID=A0ABY3YJQ9_9FLAO|nr:hypothetical protein [Zhouia spongiae]UNY97886.1 hypothetical protein MQE36_12415 [Zhouia spongiae]
MAKLILIIIAFIYIYPIFLQAIPVPLDRVLQAIGFFTFIVTPNFRIKIIRASGFWKFYFLTFIILILVFFAQLRVGSNDLYFFKTIADTFLSFFSSYLIIWFGHQYIKRFNLAYLLQLIVFLAVIQSLISFFFFTNPGIYETYLSFLNETANEGLISRIGLLNKRFMGIGSNFFSGVIKYGLALFSLIILPYYDKKLIISKNKYLYWFCLLMILVGGVLTGRTFFVAIALGLVMKMFLEKVNIILLLRRGIKLIIILAITIPIILLVAKSFIDLDRLSVVYGFIFELFINFLSEGEISTSSTNKALDMYIFPDNIETWFYGDGKMLMPTGEYYMGTDIGFIRLIFYFGIISTLLFYLVLIYYGKIIKKLIKIKSFNIYIAFVMIWIIILNLKGIAYGNYFFVLLLVAAIVEKNNRRNMILKKYKSKVNCGDD